jgi:hypothetical protein
VKICLTPVIIARFSLFVKANLFLSFPILRPADKSKLVRARRSPEEGGNEDFKQAVGEGVESEFS